MLDSTSPPRIYDTLNIMFDTETKMDADNYEHRFKQGPQHFSSVTVDIVIIVQVY